MTETMMRSKNLIDMALGTLAAETAINIALDIDQTRLQGAKPKEITYAVEWRAKTTLEGPLVYGLSEGLTSGEVAEWWTADPQYGDDPGAAEASMRHVLILGYIPLISQTFPLTSDEHGDLMRTARWPGWEVIEGENLNFFVLNIGLAALTAGTLVDGFVMARGDWLDK